MPRPTDRNVRTGVRRRGRTSLSVASLTVGAMRILHTSDWHIGRTLHGVDLLADQAAALAAIADLVGTHGVDVVVVPGDIYDRSVPGVEAITVCNDGLAAIRAAGAHIVATSGNHDSPARLGAGAAFAAAGGLHLRTRVADVADPVLLADADGPVAFYGIPYLEPDLARGELDVPDARSHADILTAAMARIHADRAGRPGIRSVVLSHAFVQGGAAAGSERTIAVGGVETVPAELFAGIDYVALGHLHSPQTIDPRIRYSGSPLPYSFAEGAQAKAVWMIDLDEVGAVTVIRHDLPVSRQLARITGELDQLLTDSALSRFEDHYVSAVLTDPTRPADPMRRLRARFPHAVHLEWERPTAGTQLCYRERVRGRSDLEIARRFVADVRDRATPGELDWLDRALTAAAVESEHPGDATERQSA